RMKEHLAEKKIKPADAMYICGAVHAVSDVEEYGSGSKKRWDIPPRTSTTWLYGLIPSSHAAIDHQFHFPPGTVTLSEASWDKHRRAVGVNAFTLTATKRGGEGEKGRKGDKKKRTAPQEEAPAASPPLPISPSPPLPTGDLVSYLTRPPALAGADEEQLLGW